MEKRLKNVVRRGLTMCGSLGFEALEFRCKKYATEFLIIKGTQMIT